MVEDEIGSMIRDMKFRMAMQGIRAEDYMRYTGLTDEKMREYYRSDALRRVRSRLVLEAIRDAEGITADEESVDKRIRKIAEGRGKQFDETKAQMGRAGARIHPQRNRHRQSH
jgi:trigger factor